MHTLTDLANTINAIQSTLFTPGSDTPNMTVDEAIAKVLGPNAHEADRFLLGMIMNRAQSEEIDWADMQIRRHEATDKYFYLLHLGEDEVKSAKSHPRNDSLEHDHYTLGECVEKINDYVNECFQTGKTHGSHFESGDSVFAISTFERISHDEVMISDMRVLVGVGVIASFMLNI